MKRHRRASFTSPARETLKVLKSNPWIIQIFRPTAIYPYVLLCDF